MASSMLQPRKRGSLKLNELNPQHRTFVEALLADPTYCITKAARSAGYRNPSATASQLMAKPEIRAAIGVAIRERIENYKLEAGVVLKHLATALSLDPLELFERDESGSFRVKSLEDIPVEIRRCITKIKAKTVTTDEGTVTYLEVDLMNKNDLMNLAMKHLGLMEERTTNVNMNVSVDDVLISELLTKVEEQRSVIDTNFIQSQVPNAIASE